MVTAAAPYGGAPYQEGGVVMASDRLFLLTTVSMLSSYSETHCPPHGDKDSWFRYLMVLSSFLPFITYMIMTFLAFYSRTPDHFVKSQGALICDLFVWALQSVIPEKVTTDALCEDRTIFTVSSSSAIAVYFSLAFLASELSKQKPVNWTNRLLVGNMGLWYIANVVLSCYSQVYLYLSSPPEVAVGAAVGAFTAALVAMLCNVLFKPRMKEPWCQYILTVCLVHGPWFDEPQK